MSFFEPLSATQDRSRALWDKGVSDFHKLGILGKSAAAGVGVGTAIAGVGYGVVKTLGVSSYEFYSQSFGEKRGKTLFDYLTGAPVVQMLVTGAFAEGVGAALHYFGLSLPWNIVPTTFLLGAVTYLGAQFTRYLADVVGVTAHGMAGNAVSWVRHGLKPEPGDKHGGDKPAPQPTVDYGEMMRLPGGPVFVPRHAAMGWPTPPQYHPAAAPAAHVQHYFTGPVPPGTVVDPGGAPVYPQATYARQQQHATNPHGGYDTPSV